MQKRSENKALKLHLARQLVLKRADKKEFSGKLRKGMRRKGSKFGMLEDPTVKLWSEEGYNRG